jgi:hypothetical protein
LTSPISVVVAETRTPDRTLRTLTVDATRQATYEITGPLLPPPLDTYDFAAVATVFQGMRERRPLHIDGPVTTTLLRNLEELQEVWSMWQPSLYKPVRITAAEERGPSPQPLHRKGVFAFSGGVDSAAALLRHYSGDLNRRAVTPVAAIMVHGFDIPLDATEAFNTARAAAAASLKELGLPLCAVRTDWRHTLCKRWEMEYCTGLIACLHQFAGMADVGVLGADEDYAHLVIPWASTPITNPLLSGGAFAIQTECGALTRTERVALAARFPKIASGLRVCWQGPMSGRNCGKCEKCLRTQLNFLAAGLEPVCFDTKPTAAQILGITTSNPIQLTFLEEIVASAHARGIKASWLSALEISLVKNRVLLPFRTRINALRSTARRVLKPAART